MIETEGTHEIIILDPKQKNGRINRRSFTAVIFTSKHQQGDPPSTGHYVIESSIRCRQDEFSFRASGAVQENSTALPTLHPSSTS